LDVISAFSTVIDISPLTTAEHLSTVVDDSQAFSPKEVDQIRQELAKQPRFAIFFLFIYHPTSANTISKRNST
jgi:DNA-binding transcriptional regulator YiaG